MAYENIIILAIVVMAIVIYLKTITNKKKKERSIQKYHKDKQRDLYTIKQEQNEKGLDLLKERLASGKITKEEYDNLKREFE